mgnify:CR=1 FL=1
MNLSVFLLSIRTILLLWNDILSVLRLDLLKLKPILTSVQIILLQNLLISHRVSMIMKVLITQLRIQTFVQTIGTVPLVLGIVL